MSAPGWVVQAEHVVAGYRLAGFGPRRAVLHGVSFRLEPRTVTAVLGANGAGKTTLLRVLLGFLRPWSGTVAVGGAPPRGVRRRRGLAYLPEAVELPSGWSVDRLLREGRRLAGVPAGASGAGLVDAALQPWLGRRTSILSRGITRRVALEFALAGQPPLVVLDEPFAGLDPPSREALARTIRRLPRRGASVLLATHDLGEAARLADGVLVLSHGRAVSMEAPDGSDPARLLALVAGEVAS